MWIEIILGLGLLFLYVYRYVTKNFDEFKKRGIPYAEPSFPFGSKNAKSAIMGQRNFFDVDKEEAYNEFKDEKMWGYFMFGQPTLVINDEELAKHIMIKDFDHFTDLRSFGYESKSKDGLLIKYMFTNMKGDKWKKARAMMSGVFTSGKLKYMTPYIVQCSENMEGYLEKIEKNNEDFEARDLASIFTLDAFASAGFGIEQNSFTDPKNIFREMAMTLIGAPGFGSAWDMPRAIFVMTFPKLSKLLGIPNFPMKPVNFIANIIERTVAERMKTGYKRNDIIDVCIEEMKKNEDNDDFKEFVENKEAFLMANALMLFFAGFDTQAITISQVLHNMVKNSDVQDRLCEEIDEALEKTNGKITYEILDDIPYLDWVIKESMRYKMLFTAPERVCTKDYKIPNTDIIIPKGRIVHLFVGNIINDKKNFINPEKFDPENFNPENFTNKFAHMAFGQGPRGCPGTRYAYLAVKIFLVQFLRQYKAIPCEKTNMGDAELDPHLMFAIKGGVYIKLKKRE